MKKHIIINLTLVSSMLSSMSDNETSSEQNEHLCVHPAAAFFEVETYQDEQLFVEEMMCEIPLEQRDLHKRHMKYFMATDNVALRCY